MKSENAAHFEMVKLQNKKLIRNLLREESPQGIAQLKDRAALSYPTVAGLLKELAIQGEVLQTTETESCGGRPGVRYELNDAYQYALVLYFKDWTLQAVIYDACARQAEKLQMAVDEQLTVSQVVVFAQEIQSRYPALSAVVVGIPGVVFQKEITYLPKFPGLQGRALYERLHMELQAEVLIENDINAVAYAEAGERMDFAHIAYVNGCIGVGIVLHGEIMNGSHGNAGEMEYLCQDISQQAETLATCILSLVCVLDLPEILISGGECTQEHVRDIRQLLKKRLPETRIPQMTVIEETDHLYVYGLMKHILNLWTESE